jgi:hypothetical protein
VKRKRQGAKGWRRCTVADVQNALRVQRTDPAKFERSPRLQWVLATCQDLMSESARWEESRWNI